MSKLPIGKVSVIVVFATLIISAVAVTVFSNPVGATARSSAPASTTCKPSAFVYGGAISSTSVSSKSTTSVVDGKTEVSTGVTIKAKVNKFSNKTPVVNLAQLEKAYESVCLSKYAAEEAFNNANPAPSGTGKKTESVRNDSILFYLCITRPATSNGQVVGTGHVCDTTTLIQYDGFGQGYAGDSLTSTFTPISGWAMLWWYANDNWGGGGGGGNQILAYTPSSYESAGSCGNRSLSITFLGANVSSSGTVCPNFIESQWAAPTTGSGDFAGVNSGSGDCRQVAAPDDDAMFHKGTASTSFELRVSLLEWPYGC